MALNEPSFTVGIEEEYLLVDLETLDLAPEPPAELFKDCEAALGNQVSPEFLRSQIEIGTKVCTSIADVREDLAHLRHTIADITQKYGLAPIACSTHPFARWRQQQTTDKARYNELAQNLQVVGRRLLISGMHIHAGIEDKELRIDLMNQLRYFLPHLLAMSTSSPFWQGTDTGLKCYRLPVFNEMPRTGITPIFESYSEYTRTVSVLREAGVIEDATKIWWDARPSERFPTIEMRICDMCPLIDDSICITAFYLCLLRMLYRLRRSNQRWRAYPDFLLEENRWRAGRHGIDQGLIDFGQAKIIPFKALIDELIDLTAEDAEFFDCQKDMKNAYKILERGTSADRQLAQYQALKDEGADDLEALRAVVKKLILETKQGL